MNEAEELLLMFQKMGTTDHDTLLKQFQTIIPGVDPDIAKFFLDANSWILQNAIASFFENNGDDVKKQIAVLNRQPPQMIFSLKDDGIVQYLIGSPFKKVWHVRNSGNAPWPQGCTLDHVGGDPLGAAPSIHIPSLGPGESGDMAIEFKTPLAPGEYHGSWMMCTSGDNPIHFGEPFWVIVSAVAPVPQPHNPSFGFQQPTFFFGNASQPSQQQPAPQFGQLFQQQLNNQNPFMFGGSTSGSVNAGQGPGNPSMDTF